MNYTQNRKIAQVTETTLVVGVDIGSQWHYARAFDWRGIEITKKAFRFSNDLDGYTAFEKWVRETAKNSAKMEVLIGCEPTGHYWYTFARYVGLHGMKLAFVNPYHVKQSKEMDDNGWEYGQDDEELFELAMHPEQYRDYKSGAAKKRFLADLQKAKDAKLGATLKPEEIAAFKHAKADAIVSPCKGQVFFDFEGGSECTPCLEPYIGQHYKEGETFCYIHTPWGEFEAIPAALGGKLVEIAAKQGSRVNRGDVIAYIERDWINA